jgi:hypothetical protein
MSFLALLVVMLSGLLAQAQTPPAAPSAAPATLPPPSAGAPPAHATAVRRLVYQFGYNTPVASQGTGTGTTTIDIGAPAPDGGVIASGQDNWWSSARPRAWNSCSVHPSGGVACTDRPYAISPIQVTIFPLLGSKFFSGLVANPTGRWERKFKIKAAVNPGGQGFSGNLYTWDCDIKLQGKGKAPDSHFIMVQATGTMKQEGGRYNASNVQAGIAYDPAVKLPVYVSENRAHLPQTSVYNKDLVQLQLLKTSKVPPNAHAAAAPAPAPT